MSLINQMLKDLEGRHPAEAVVTPLSGVGIGASGGQSVGKKHTVLVVIIGVLAVVVAFLLGMQESGLTRLFPVAVPEPVANQNEVMASDSGHEIEIVHVDGQVKSETMVVPILADAQSLDSPSALIAAPQEKDSRVSGLQAQPSHESDHVKAAAPVEPKIKRVDVKPRVIRTEVNQIEVVREGEVTRVLISVSHPGQYNVGVIGSNQRKTGLVLTMNDVAPFDLNDAVYRDTGIKSISVNKSETSTDLVIETEARVALLGSRMVEQAEDYQLVLEMKSDVRMVSSPAEAEIDSAASVVKLEKPGNNEPVAPHVSKTERPLSETQQAEVMFQDIVKLLEKGRQVEALDQLSGVLALDPGHLHAREVYASLLMNKGRITEASSILEEGLELDSRAHPLAKLYARILLSQAEIKKSIRVLEQAAPAMQVDPDYFSVLAAIYHRDSRFSEAAEIYNRLLSLKPGVANWWMGLGIANESMGQQQAAYKAYTRAQKVGGLGQEVDEYVAQRIAVVTAAIPDSASETNKTLYETTLEEGF